MNILVFITEEGIQIIADQEGVKARFIDSTYEDSDEAISLNGENVVVQDVEITCNKKLVKRYL